MCTETIVSKADGKIYIFNKGKGQTLLHFTNILKYNEVSVESQNH